MAKLFKYAFKIKLAEGLIYTTRRREVRADVSMRVDLKYIISDRSALILNQRSRVENKANSNHLLTM